MNKPETTAENLGKILNRPLVDEIKRSYLDYAMSVIVGRALPDARDGLKPVQRRILYAMLGLGIKHNQPYKKSARVVGETMGKFHPHGDSAIYETMVRMAQSWSMRYPLVDGQGNFGSIDGDSAAAMRYTEARFAKTGEAMLDHIDEDTVDWGPNFDESLQEPLALPALLPNLLLNGSTGIAVGMATNMPPHNLGETVDALRHLIRHPDATVGDLMKFLPGPDFPTGGAIIGNDGIIEAYTTGRGKLTVRGTCHIEEPQKGERGRSKVVITEIPYMVNKTTLIENIVKGFQEKHIDDIADLRDESDREGLRIVIEVARDGDPELVRRQLFSRTQLQTTFSIINLALVDNRPVELNLLELLNNFLNHRRDVVRRRTQFRLNKAESRRHIVEGLCRALDMIDQVISLIRASKTTDEARDGLVHMGFTETQANAILEMRLQRLTGLEREKLLAELTELLEAIAGYQRILADSSELDNVIADELSTIKHNFNDPRRTKILPKDLGQDYKIEDLIPEEELLVTLSRDGLLRRGPMDNFDVQGRGGRGRKGATLSEDDAVALMAVTTTHRDVYLFTSSGRVFALKGHAIPETKTGKGRPVGKFIALGENEKVVFLWGCANNDCASHLMLVTACGKGKRISSSELENLTRAGRRIITVQEGDELITVVATSGNDDLLFTTSDGQCLRTNEEQFRAQGRGAQGVRAISLAKGERVVNCKPVLPNEKLLVISELGLGKKIDVNEFSNHHRGGKGIRAMKLNAKSGKLAAAIMINEDEQLAVMTQLGRVIRLNAADIPLLSRNATGYFVMRPYENDVIVDAQRISGSLKVHTAPTDANEPSLFDVDTAAIEGGTEDQ